jgi:hypothetical protein
MSGLSLMLAIVEAVERRALLLLVPVALVLAFNNPVYFTSERGRGWEVALYVLGLICLAAAAVLVVVITAPNGIVNVALEQRERLYFFACALLVAELVSVALLRAWATYYLHKHPLG